MVAADFSLRDGGRGRGLDLRDDASSSVSVGRGPRLGVDGTGRPLAFPRPWAEERRGGVIGGDVGNGGVVDGGAALESGSLGSSILALLDWPARADVSEGGVIGRARFATREGDKETGGRLEEEAIGWIIFSRD